MSYVEGMANPQVPMGHWGLGIIWSLVIGHLPSSIGHWSLVILESFFNRPMGNLSDTLRDFRSKDLRWSYGAVAILILIGVLSNIFFRHGWAIWPFCFAAGAMAMIHEAAD